MRVKLINLTYAPALAAIDDRPLESFVRDKEVLEIREHFFEVRGLPHLACLITYRDPPPSKRAERTASLAHGDLDERERALFDTLRNWRRDQSNTDGVPAYVIATNRELVSIVRAMPRSASALAAIDGIGNGKVERYGAALLTKLHGPATTHPQRDAKPPAQASA